MHNTNIDKVTEEIILIVQDNFHKLNANKRYTLRQMAGEDAWSLIKGLEKGVGMKFSQAVKSGKLALTHIGENGSNSNLYQMI